MKRYAVLFFVMVMVVTNTAYLLSQVKSPKTKKCPLDSLNQEFLFFDQVLIIVKDISVFAVYERGCLKHWGPILNVEEVNQFSYSSSMEVQDKVVVALGADSELIVWYTCDNIKKFGQLTLKLLPGDASLVDHEDVANVEILDTLTTIQY